MVYTILPDGTYAAGIKAYYDNDYEILDDQFWILTIKNDAVATSMVGSLL